MRVIGELGRPRTLPGGAEQFREIHRPKGPERAALVLGLGPEPGRLDQDLGLAGSLTYYMEAPDFLAQAKGITDVLSRSWMRRDPAWLMSLSRDELRSLRILRYMPGARVFPSFWGPILGRVRVLLAGALPGALPGRRVLLPGEKNGLLLRELAHALDEAGWKVDVLPVERGAHPDPEALARLLSVEPAALYFSINFQGLDPYGEVCHMLTQAECRVAAWCVDNPWHLISGLKSGFWRHIDVFVTDHAFIADLANHGAARVHHLPLGASPALFRPRDAESGHGAGLAERVVFVGRSAFPDKAGFFAGLRVDQEAMAEAGALMASGARPDFFWWAERLGIDQRWPSKELRRVGLCAEEAGLAHRARCLRAIARRLPLTVLGDEGWETLLPQGTDVRPPVDYYRDLPEVCARAKACLNMTSLLLPAGLTQRHFDVWIAGGLLLSDATPGLDLFPMELTRPVTFTQPEEAAALLADLEAAPGRPGELRRAWKALVLAEHTYAHRVDAMLRVMGLEHAGK